MAQRWQVLLSTMQQNHINVRSIISAIVCLHNLMRMRYPQLQNAVLDQEDENHNVIPGSWREAGLLQSIKEMKIKNKATSAGMKQREYLMHYFNSPAESVP